MQRKLVIALDGMDMQEAESFIQRISEECSDLIERIIFKVHTLVAYEGLPGIKNIIEGTGSSVFWDGKFHDIPNTLKGYFGVIKNLKMGDMIEYVTIHGSNGYSGIQELVEYKNKEEINTKILSVSVLTSLSQEEAFKIYGNDLNDIVLKFSRDALKAGVNGIICSAWEGEMLKKQLGTNYSFEIITPGIRPTGSEKGDQSRVVTPKEAISMGANHIVVGRPITESSDPGNVVKQIFNDLNS